MKEMRLMGSYLKHLTDTNNMSYELLSIAIKCDYDFLLRFFNGECFLSFEQLEKLSDMFKVSVAQLIAGDEDIYKKTIKCYGEFENEDNKEEILDIISDYLTLRTTVDQVTEGDE